MSVIDVWFCSIYISIIKIQLIGLVPMVLLYWNVMNLYLRGLSWLWSYGWGFTITAAISAYHHLSFEFEPRSWRGVLDTILCDNVCQWLAAGQWFSPSTHVSSTNKSDRLNITEILLKVELNTITQTLESL